MNEAKDTSKLSNLSREKVNQQSQDNLNDCFENKAVKSNDQPINSPVKIPSVSSSKPLVLQQSQQDVRSTSSNLNRQQPNSADASMVQQQQAQVPINTNSPSPNVSPSPSPSPAPSSSSAPNPDQSKAVNIAEVVRASLKEKHRSENQLNLSSSTQSTISAEESRLNELLPRLPDTPNSRVRHTRTKYKAVICDWRYLMSCSGRCAVLIMLESFIITSLVVLVSPECKQVIVGLQSSCLSSQILAIISSLFGLFQFILIILYTSHMIERFNQVYWLRFELFLHFLFTVALGITASLTLSQKQTFLWVGVFGMAATLKGVILTIDRLFKLCIGKPAQAVLDDADGNRTRIGIMRLRFGIHSIS